MCIEASSYFLPICFYLSGGLLISVFLFIYSVIFSYMVLFFFCSRRIDVFGLVERRVDEIYGWQVRAQDDVVGRGQVQVLRVE